VSRKRDWLFVQSTTELGGAEQALLNFFVGSEDLARSSAVVTLGFGEGDLPARLKGSGVQVIQLPRARLRSPGRVGSTILAIARCAREFDVRAVVGNGSHPQIFASIAARIAGLPSIYYVHTRYRTPLRLNHALDQVSLLGKVDVFIANSEATRASLRALRPAVPSQVVYPGTTTMAVPRPIAAKVRSDLGVADDEVLFAAFGRLQNGKGQDIFIEAAARIAVQCPSARFLVVGGTVFGLEPEYASDLRRQVARAGLERRLLFAGHRADVPAVMAACDVVVMPSRYFESFGMVVIEGGAQGKPSIATRCGGPEETVVDGVTGCLVAPDDAERLADAMRAVANDPGLRARMGAAAKERVESRFTAHAAGEALIAALHWGTESSRRD
jgi:glycosyltransferase involved in cell wall biosynthesis